MAQYFPWILPQASSFAGQIDFVFWFITAICAVVGAGVTFFLLLFCIRYRQGTKVNRKLPHHEGMALELIWTIIPLVIMVFMFFLSTIVYFQTIRPPADATEIFVVGKQWMWKIQHPNGRWEMNELHIPVGKPVKLTMISEDVIHDFGLPAFRLNMDVVPGRYTQTWFNPVREGKYHIFCAQFCGMNHAIMGGYVYVQTPDEYEKWMAQGNVQPAMASRGEKLFRDQGCTGCQGARANVRAPSLVGLYNSTRSVQIPNDGIWKADMPVSSMPADARYIHDSIYLPAKEVAAGYRPIMPSYQGRLSEEQILQLVDYIKTLRTSNGTSNGSRAGYQPFGSSDPQDLSGSEGLRNPDGSPASVVIGQRNSRSTATPVNGGNALGLSDLSDARTGKLYGGNPTGDMADNNDREAVLRSFGDQGTTGDAASGKLYGTSPNGDMSNNRDRENIFHNGGGTSSSALLDNSAGGMHNDSNHKRGGLNVYRSKNYTDSNVPVYSGGLHSQVPAGGGR